MNSELSSCNNLLESLSILEDLTVTYSSDSVLERLDQISDERRNNVSRHPFAESKERMKKISELVSNSDEYKFCIRNLYDALEKQESGANIILTQHDDRSEDYYLAKAIISVSNKRPDTQASYVLDSIRSNYRTSKRKRCILSSETKDFLQRAFDAQPFPNRKDRELLAKKCGLTKLQVRVWFTNKRMRSKRNS